MQFRPEQITVHFAAETQFEIETQPAMQILQIPHLLELPRDDQRMNVLLKPFDHRGIPPSALND